MHGAAVCDLHEPGALTFVQRAAELDLAVDDVQPAVGIVLAVLAVLGVDAPVLEADSRLVQGPLLAARVHLEGHGRACAEAGDEEVVGGGSGIVASHRLGLVGH